jgi:spoIIIJ-associated protein
MRSRRSRKRYERTIPKPEIVIDETPTPTVSLEDATPSRARERPAYEPSAEDDAAVVEVTEDLLDAADVDADIEFLHEDYQRVWIEVDPKGAGTLIGKRGSGIEALEVLISRMASHKVGHMVPVQVDVNQYRAKHEEELRELAKELAARVLESGVDEHLQPMNARDRRVVHLTVQEMEGLETYSLGEGSAKHIVIHKTNN